VTIPPATIPVTPQATSTYASTSSQADGDFAATGFSQALSDAGFDGPATHQPGPLQASPPTSANSLRSAKAARQQPEKDEKKSAPSVPVMTHLEAALAPAVHIPGLSLDPENQDASADGSGDKPPANRAVIANSPAQQPNPPVPENPPLAQAGDLAFAAKVQPASTADVQPAVPPRPLKTDSTSPEQPLPKKAGEKDVAEPTLVQPVAASAESALASHGQHAYANQEIPTAASAAPSTPHAPGAPLAPAEAKMLEPQAKSAASPLKDISVQVSQPGDQKVEVRLVQQSGELHVAVRTGDSDLAHGLQQGLPELVGRLQENGFRAEAWRPGGVGVQAGPVLETRTTPGGSQNSNSQSHSGGSHQSPGERRQNQPQRPGWVEELENSVAGGQQSQAQGAAYGIGN